MQFLLYVGKKVLIAFTALIVLTTFTFILMNLLPGNPFESGKDIPDAIMKSLNVKYGLDKPPVERYFIYLSNVLHGDFGESTLYRGRTVNSLVLQSFPYSFDLGIRALIFAVIGGLFLGIVASVNHGRRWDSLSILIAVIGVSVPSFIMGSILQYFVGLHFSTFLKQTFGLPFSLFPVTGWDSDFHKILPSFALGLGALASISRLMRSSMLDVMGQDYIKTAKSKGLSATAIIFKHAVRNAILPVVTYLGPLSAAILTGAFVVENIFNVPGMGKFLIQSVQMKDPTMIMGLTVFYGFFLIAANMLVEIAYGLIDPRIRQASSKGVA